jgi:ACR3 family arsenite efflux pump ArsB
MTTQSSFAERVLPAIAVGLGLGHAALLGGIATPVAFTRALLAVGVLCPLMMGQSSARVGRIVLRPQARLLPLLVSLALGPALALALGKVLLQNHPEQASALLLLSVLPGSALAPLWASGTGTSRSTALALALMGGAIATFVSLPLLTSPFASVASFIALRDLAILGVMPLAVGGVCRVALLDVFDSEEYATNVEPIRRTVLHASFSVLLFTSTASRQIATLLRGVSASLPALAAVSLLYLGLAVGCVGLLLAFRPRLSRAAARATLLVSTSRQTALAMSVLPLVVAPSALPVALGVPLVGMLIEFVLGTAALTLHGSWTHAPSATAAGNQDGCPSIVPE